MGEYTCHYCNKECKNPNSLRQHETRCIKNPNCLDEYKNNNEYICKYCGRKCKNENGLKGHERVCHKNPNIVDYYKFSEEGYLCSICHQVCHSKASLYQHEKNCKRRASKPKEIHICKFCGKEFTEKHGKNSSWNFCSKICARKYASNMKKNVKRHKKEVATYTHQCQYCGRKLKNNYSVKAHECRCPKNPYVVKIYEEGKRLPRYITPNKKVEINKVELDITQQELEEYRKEVTHCEICGRTLDESIKWTSDNHVKNFCTDHDHNTNKFRGLLCQSCNRQLGWFEKYFDKANKYLNRNENDILNNIRNSLKNK